MYRLNMNICTIYVYIDYCKDACNKANLVKFTFSHYRSVGPVAQWITRLTTNQKIAGSSPARIDFLGLTNTEVRNKMLFPFTQLHQLLIENLKVTINSPILKEGWRSFFKINKC
jgi:hypothetical protein